MSVGLKPQLTTGKKIVSIPLRFHPNGTGTPYTCSAGHYGSAEVKTVSYVQTGRYKVVLHSRHELIVGAVLDYHTTSAPATNTTCKMFYATSGAANENSLLVQLAPDGVTSNPTYSAYNYVHGVIHVEDLL